MTDLLQQGAPPVAMAVLFAAGLALTAGLLYGTLLGLQCLWAWRRARNQGAPLSFRRIAAWRLGRLRWNRLLSAAVRARRQGLDASPGDIEAAALAGGDPMRALQAMEEARRRGASLDFVSAAALDLSEEVNAVEAAKTWKVVSVRGVGVLVSPEGEFVLGQRSAELSSLVGRAAGGER